jgi:hypothetical protein
MSDNVIFDGTSNSPTANTVVATDYVGTGGGGSAHFQRMKVDIGPDGTTIPLAWGGTGMPLGTLPGTVQALGTYQPLAGSVHLANAITGTVQVHGTTQVLGTVQALSGGTVQVHGTLQALGTYQPLAGSVHPAAALPGTSHITGTVRILDPAAVTQSGAWAVTVDGTVQSLGTYQPLAGSVHVANTITGTVQTHGTSQVLGTTQPLAGSVHLASILPGGSVSAQGYVAHGAAAAGNPLPLGGFGSSGAPTAVDEQDAVRLWADLTGRLQVVGSVTTAPTGTQTVLGTIQAHGTTQALGTVQPLAGSVHLANTISGTVQTHGTSQVLGTVRALVDAGTVQVLGSVQTVGTSQVLGSVRVLDPVDVTPAVPAANDYLPVRLTDGAAFYTASSGAGGFSVVDEAPFTAAGSYMVPIGGFVTADAAPDGSVGAVAMTTGRALYVAVQGTAQALGTVQPLAGSVHVANAISGTVQTHGTSQVLGSVRSVGTTEALGTFQPLAGSVHLASILPGGSVSVQGYVAAGAAAAGNPVLMAAFGSSGTQAGVDDGDAVRLWADLNGRLQIIGSVTAAAGGGTYQMLGSVQTHGTTQALGTYQPLAGSVHLASFLPGGTVQTHGTSQVLGSVRSVGTTEVLGTMQPLAGSVHIASTPPGTTQVIGTVRAMVPTGTALGEQFFGTIYTAAANDATLIAAPGAGTFVRIYDILVSGSAAGTVRLLDNAEGTAYGHLHLAANGGWNFNSSRGVRSRAANRAVLLDCTAGTWGIMINYALET